MRRWWCWWVFLLPLGLPRIALGDNDAGSNAFDANSATFVAEQVTKLMQAAWSQAYTLTSAFDSGMLGSGTLQESKRSGHRGSHVNNLVDDNATRQLIWANYKKTTLGADFVYIGFENGKFICYAKDNFFSSSKFYSYMSEVNATCTANYPGADGRTVKNCLRDYCAGDSPRYGIDNVTGAPKLATDMYPFIATDRTWYKAAQASSIGQAWSPVYVFAAACANTGSDLGITGSAVVHNLEGVELGVVGVDYGLVSIESLLSKHLSDLPHVVAFIVENATEKLVASSIPNITTGYSVSGEAFQVTAINTSTCGGVPQPTDATYVECRNRASIRQAARELTSKYSAQDGKLFLMKDTVPDYSGNFWVLSQEISDAFGLAWHLVFIERVTCSENYFLDTSSKACQPCANNEASEEGNNDVMCHGCAEGFYRKKYNDDKQRNGRVVDECAECPTGATCPGGTELPRVKKGYFQFPDVATVYPCRLRRKGSNLKSNCMAWNSTTAWARNRTCKEGSTGHLCSTCQENYYSSEVSAVCKKCRKPQIKSLAWLVFCVSVLVVLLAFGFICISEKEIRTFLKNKCWPTCHKSSKDFETETDRHDPYVDPKKKGNRTSEDQTPKTKLLIKVIRKLERMYHRRIRGRIFANTEQVAGWKSLVTALQIIHSTTQTIPEIEFPGIFVRTRAVLGQLPFVSLNILDFTNVECRFKLSYYAKVLTTGLIPIIIYCLIHGIYLLMWRLINCCGGGAQGAEESEDTEEQQEHGGGAQGAEESEDTEEQQQRSGVHVAQGAEESEDTEEQQQRGGGAQRAEESEDTEPRTQESKPFHQPLLSLKKCLFPHITHFVKYTLIVAYFSLPAVSRATFSVWNCIPFQTKKGKRESFLEADLTVKCRPWRLNHGGELNKLRNLAFGFMFSPWGGPIGTVVFTFCVLVWHKKTIRCPKFAEKSDNDDIVEERQKVKEIQHFAFLYAAYQPIFWWFEIYETLRRIALTGGILLIKDVGRRLFYAEMLALTSMLVHDSTNPYLSEGIGTANFCANLTHSAVFLVFFSAERIRSGAMQDAGLVWWEIMMEVGIPLFIVVVVLLKFQGPLERRRLVVSAEKRAERMDLNSWIRSKLQEERADSEENEGPLRQTSADTTDENDGSGEDQDITRKDIKDQFFVKDWKDFGDLKDIKVWVMSITDLQEYQKELPDHETAKKNKHLKELNIYDEKRGKIKGSVYVISHTWTDKDKEDRCKKKLEFLKNLPEHMNLTSKNAAERAASNRQTNKQTNKNEKIWIWMDHFSIPTSDKWTDPRQVRKYYRSAFRASSRIVPLVERKKQRLVERELKDSSELRKAQNKAAEKEWLKNSPWAKLDILQALCPRKYWPEEKSSSWKRGPIGQRFYFYDDERNEGMKSGSVLTVSHLKDPRINNESTATREGDLTPQSVNTTDQKSKAATNTAIKMELNELAKKFKEHAEESKESGTDLWELTLLKQRPGDSQDGSLPNWLMECDMKLTKDESGDPTPLSEKCCRNKVVPDDPEAGSDIAEGTKFLQVGGV